MCHYDTMSQLVSQVNSLGPINVLRNECGSTCAHNGHYTMMAKPRGNLDMAFGEDKTFSWASGRLRGPYILCDQVPGVRPGYYPLTAVGFGLGSCLLR